jgi:hypothetical protein
MWPIQLFFRLLISCRIFLCSLTLSNTYFFISHMIGPTDLLQHHHHISKLSRCFRSTARSTQISAPYTTTLQMKQLKI